MSEFKLKKFDLKMGGKKIDDSKMNWISFSKKKKKDETIFVYLSYNNGRVYSFVKTNSDDIKFNDKTNEITYVWEGMWEGKTKTYNRKIIFKMQPHIISEYNKIKSMFEK